MKKLKQHKIKKYSEAKMKKELKTHKIQLSNSGPNRAERRKSKNKLKLTRKMKQIRKRVFYGEHDITGYEKLSVTPHQYVKYLVNSQRALMAELHNRKEK